MNEPQDFESEITKFLAHTDFQREAARYFIVARDLNGELMPARAMQNLQAAHVMASMAQLSMLNLTYDMLREIRNTIANRPL